jgi:hypothetical protein
MMAAGLLLTIDPLLTHQKGHRSRCREGGLGRRIVRVYNRPSMALI